MKIHRRFLLTIAAVLALAAGSGGGWAIAQDSESGHAKHSAGEHSGEHSGTTTGESREGESGENEASGEESDNNTTTTVTTTESTATVAQPTETTASFTG